MRLFLLVVCLFAVTVSGTSAQERHYLDPEQEHRFSICIREDCLDNVPSGEVVLLQAGVKVWQGFVVTEVTCRYEDRDIRMGRSSGQKTIILATQFYAPFFRWCNLFVRNYSDTDRAEYSASVIAEPEREFVELWLSQKRTRPVP